jgi:hypothetical protein
MSLLQHLRKRQITKHVTSTTSLQAIFRKNIFLLCTTFEKTTVQQNITYKV